MKARLTERQNQAYEFIRAYMRTHRKPPTLKEIGQALGIRSTNGVFKLLRALETKGYLQREPNAARGLRLADDEADPFALDEGAPTLIVVSRTASDQPEQLRRRPSGYLTVDPYFLRGVMDAETCVIGRAGDDGMNGDGIRKGDFVVIEEAPWNQLRNGELSAFLVGEELLIRRFYFANDRLHLRPADRTYTEETFSPADPRCHVIGRVIALMRRLR
ncbi:MAG: LexA family transcriptional regulator [Bacteroidetes bacterium]|nr:MAG: LexA family transcriptional regulator [Bacteroidota bacterium]